MNYERISRAFELTKWKELFKLLIALQGYLLSPFIGLILKSKANKCGENVECLVNLAYNFGQNSLLLRPFTIKPSQVYTEILSLAKIIHKLKPKAVVEIGTAGGGTLFIWCRLSSDDATIVSIDLPGGPFGGGYASWRIPLYRSFKKSSQRLFLLRADSHNQNTLKAVKKIVNQRKVDFLFIDGDHTYEGVKRDFEMYGPLIRRGGIIAFHDIVPHPPETGCEVSRFYNEIKECYKHEELIENPYQNGLE